MRLREDPETDSLHLESNAATCAETREISLDIDLQGTGVPIGLDVDHASQKLDLATLA